MRKDLVCWQGEMIEIDEPETLQEFVDYAFVETEEDLVRLAYYGWKLLANRAFAMQATDPNTYTYKFSGIRRPK